jgi:hypothetical protein
VRQRFINGLHYHRLARDLQVCKSASTPVLLAAQTLATSLGMLLVQLQGMQQQEQHTTPSMQLLLWQMLVRGQAATVQQQLKDFRCGAALY